MTPGVSSTIASLRPINLLISVDLPTFGRPRIATIGSPSNERSLSNSQTRSTVSSKSSSVESIKTASLALANGETARVESISSLSESDVETLAMGAEISLDRLAARAAISACR